jgi:tetratricopeptide (TPR) repeat protein
MPNIHSVAVSASSFKDLPAAIRTISADGRADSVERASSCRTAVMSRQAKKMRAEKGAGSSCSDGPKGTAHKKSMVPFPWPRWWTVAAGLAIGLAAAGGLSAIMLSRAGDATAVQGSAGPQAPRERADEAEAAIRAGQRFFAEQQYDRAFAAFERAHALAPADPRPIHALGRIAGLLNQISTAEQRFREALAVDPRFVPALTDLAIVLGRMGRPGEAVTLLERACEQQPGDISIRSLLGQNLLRDGQARRAAEVFEDCLKLPTADRLATLYAFLGRARMEAGQDEPARQALEKALAIDPGLAQAHLWLGQLLIKTGHEQEGQRESAAFKACRQGAVTAK